MDSLRLQENKKTKEVYRKMYVWNKQGFKRVKGNRNIKKHHRDLRTVCQAILQISKRKDGKWFVDIFNDTQNLELNVTLKKVLKHRSHGKFHRSVACKSFMVELG